MLRLRWTTVLFIVGAISSILLYFACGIRGFPEEVMYIYFPADYFWHELQNEARDGILILRKIISNVAVFGLLAGVQGALIGLIMDLRTAGGKSILDHRVRHLRRGTEKIDVAFQRRVQEILTKHDPGGLIKRGEEKDAYATQTTMILKRITKLGSARSLRKFCHQQFRHQFGFRAAHSFKEYDSLASQIWTAYGRQQSPDRQELPVSKGL